MRFEKIIMVSLILFFAALLVYQTYVAIFPPNPLIEGMESSTTSSTQEEEYKPYNVNDPNNSLILAQQNAGNIEVLKGRIDQLDGVKEDVVAMQQSMDMMQTQIDGLVQQQADYAQEIAGSTPPVVTGTEEETAEDIDYDDEEE